MWIQNVPNDTERYIVFRVSQGKAWYYGSWDNEVQAQNVAELVDGAVYDTEG